jgi:hypothetical protein
MNFDMIADAAAAIHPISVEFTSIQCSWLSAASRRVASIYSLFYGVFKR